MNEPKQLITLPIDLVARACKIPSKASQDANHQDIIDRGRAQEELRGILANPAALAAGDPVLIQAVAVTRADGEDGLRLEWLLEGGIAEMEFPEQVLFAMPEANDFCDADGSGYVYLQPQPDENQITSLPHGARLVGFVDQGQAKITLEHALKAYNYACDHPHGYLRGTTNWCAAFAHSLNQQMNSENAADGTTTE